MTDAFSLVIYLSFNTFQFAFLLNPPPPPPPEKKRGSFPTIHRNPLNVTISMLMYFVVVVVRGSFENKK